MIKKREKVWKIIETSKVMEIPPKAKYYKIKNNYDKENCSCSHWILFYDEDEKFIWGDGLWLKRKLNND